MVEETISRLNWLKKKYDNLLFYALLFAAFLAIMGLTGYIVYELFNHSRILGVGTLINLLLILSFLVIRLRMSKEIPVKRDLRGDNYKEKYWYDGKYKEIEYYIESYNFDSDKYNKFLNVLIINLSLVFIYNLLYSSIVVVYENFNTDQLLSIILVNIFIFMMLVVLSHSSYEQDKRKLEILKDVK